MGKTDYIWEGNFGERMGKSWEEEIKPTVSWVREVRWELSYLGQIEEGRGALQRVG